MAVEMRDAPEICPDQFDAGDRPLIERAAQLLDRRFDDVEVGHEILRDEAD